MHTCPHNTVLENGPCCSRSRKLGTRKGEATAGTAVTVAALHLASALHWRQVWSRRGRGSGMAKQPKFLKWALLATDPGSTRLSSTDSTSTHLGIQGQP